MVELNEVVRRTILSFLLLQYCADPFSSRKYDEKIGKSELAFSVVEESRIILILRAWRHAWDRFRAFLRHKSVYRRGQSLFFSFSKISLSSFGWDSSDRKNGRE